MNRTISVSLVAIIGLVAARATFAVPVGGGYIAPVIEQELKTIQTREQQRQKDMDYIQNSGKETPSPSPSPSPKASPKPKGKAN